MEQPDLKDRQVWTDEQWDQQLASQGEASFFHTRRWARIVLASFPNLRDASVWLDSERGPILFPLYAWRRAGGLLTTYHSSFPFLYGGPIPGFLRENVPLLHALVIRLGRPLSSMHLVGNPLLGERPASPALRGFRVTRDHTHWLDLPESEDSYWSSLTTAKRNDVRRLGKKGVVIEESREPVDIDAVYQLYLGSFRRWGGPPRFTYPLEFYRNLVAMGGEAVRLTVARREGRILGGTFTVRWNQVAHYLAGYFDHESRALRPNVLIQVDSILSAIRDEFRCYDFLPSGGHASVETFKESFGGVRREFEIQHRVGLGHRLLRARRPVREVSVHPEAGHADPGALSAERDDL